MSLKLLKPSLASQFYKPSTRTTTRTTTLIRPSLLTTRPFITTPIHRSMDEHEARGKQAMHPDDGWKQRPPYRIHDNNDDFKTRYEASCHCGKVKYQLSREEPLDSKLCHCTTCQTQHGELLHLSNHPSDPLTEGCASAAAPFQWAAIFHKDDINFSHGHHDLEWYDPTDKSIDHKLPCKVRCSFCHSPIMDEGRNMILLFPSLVHLKTDQDKANFKPR